MMDWNGFEPGVGTFFFNLVLTEPQIMDNAMNSLNHVATEKTRRNLMINT